MENRKNDLYRLEITPQTHVRATQGDKVFFRIPRANLRPAGLKRLLRLERYNQYKIDLSALCKQKGFIFPNQGAHVRFYIPCPPSWSKKKKKAYHMKLHMGKPDVDNLAKALADSLFREDKHIGDMRISKFWVDFEDGWIDIEVTDPVFNEALEMPPRRECVLV